MRVCFDTSVLVAALVDQLASHEAALACFVTYTGPRHEPCCSAHALAECYATLTALPLPTRIRPVEARQLIVENLTDRLAVVDVARADYLHAVDRVASLGLSSGVIYDALHLAVAESRRCSRLYTYNLRDFDRLSPTGVTITAP